MAQKKKARGKKTKVEDERAKAIKRVQKVMAQHQKLVDEIGEKEMDRFFAEIGRRK